ncbi:hypothetical protein N657DRAFT_621398 [Parathielavia appendiculata]|uniref:Uncharacterized protein n=1 Tax=Parathielavia appendiculata TaxID=2587402 RepID=A0AAN6Z1K3_9PEZI|nr:hypothetical protein N657DRAFT_621398 [Parathielavia appendiculata]
MESIAGSLTAKQKKRLHGVAGQMLDIYNTLARMRYLEPEWIQAGPHDVSSLMPLYRSLKLDLSIIYLYHILPYVKAPDSDRMDFFMGSSFADFRNEHHVRDGRDPFISGNDPEQMMRPWMTPLSMLGNHQCVIVYDAKRHVVGIFDQEDGRSHDPNLREGAANSDTHEQDEEKDDIEAEGENIWDEMDARPARRVLGDIVRWYHELFVTPGGGEIAGQEWNEDLVKPLYRKHGWPGEDFDGDAFLVDQVRADAARVVEYHAEEPFRQVQSLKHRVAELEENRALAMPKWQKKLAEAKSLDEEWLVRWEMWIDELDTRGMRTSLKRAEELFAAGEAQRHENLPQWELREVQVRLSMAKRQLEALKQGPSGSAQDQEAIRHAEKKTAIHERAYLASLADAERLCPGRPFTLEVGQAETGGQDYSARIERLSTVINGSEQAIEDIRGWMAQLPHGADGVRNVAQARLDYQENCLNRLKGHQRRYTEAMKGFAKQSTS